jgi:TolB-like protein
MYIQGQWRFWAGCLAAVVVGLCSPSRDGLATETARGTRVTASGKGSPPAPTLWVLAVGVSTYQDSSLKLNYADEDAKAIAATLTEQKTRGYYRDVHKRVLVNSEVTRESILDSFSGFLGQAAPQDVVVIFVAGHGMQSHEKYYFLPYPATQQTVITRGLSMSDFNDALSRLHEVVNHVVVMLDTCDAGALDPGARGISSSDAIRELAKAKGVFLLAASQAGETSRERSEWKHGAFTFSVLEGLSGKADQDGDGWLYVNELFDYVAGTVPKLTGGSQHPYEDMRGTSLVFAAVRNQEHPPEIGGGQGGEPSAPAVHPEAIFVLPFEDLSSNPEDRRAHEFTGRAVQTELTNRLSGVKALDVRFPYSVVISDAKNPLPTLRENGIGNAVSGSFAVYGHKIVLHAWIVDTVTGQQRPLGDVEGKNDDEEIFVLQTKLIQKTLQALHVDVSATEAAAAEKESNNSLSALQNLLEAEGAAGEASPPDDKKPTPSPAQPHAALDWLRAVRCRLHDFLVPAAQAEEMQAEIARVLSEYTRAYQDKDIDGLAKLYVSFPPNQAEALRTYLSKVTDLSVELDDVTVEAQDGKASVSYTRRDHFTEKATGKKINLEVHLKKTFVREDGQWKFSGG